MILYLAASAPGNEQHREEGMHLLKNRLLSYFLIKHKKFECDQIFKAIKKYNRNK